MNNLTIETASRLKTDAGWSRKTYFCWYSYLDEETSEYETWVDDTDSEAIHLINCMSPTCEELLEVLPATFKELPDQRLYQLYILKDGYFTGDDTEYRAYYAQYPESPSSKYQAEHVVCAEALALLLLKLVAQGIVSKDSLVDSK